MRMMRYFTLNYIVPCNANHRRRSRVMYRQRAENYECEWNYRNWKGFSFRQLFNFRELKNIVEVWKIWYTKREQFSLNRGALAVYTCITCTTLTVTKLGIYDEIKIKTNPILQKNTFCRLEFSIVSHVCVVHGQSEIMFCFGITSWKCIDFKN